jgi:hypothetical protein
MESLMFFRRSLIALVLCGAAACAANPNPETTFFLPGTDIPIAAGVPTWDMAADIAPVAATTWWGEPINNLVAVATAR